MALHHPGRAGGGATSPAALEPMEAGLGFCSGCTLVTVWARTQLGFLTPQSNHQSQQQSEHNAQQ